MPRIKFFLPLFLITLISCGGGGGSSTAPISNGTTFQAVASEGELVSYTVDTSAMTYSYKIIESAYGKTGVTGNGQLTRNSDGTYTPAGFNGKVALLDSGLLLGAIYEDLNNDGTREVIPVVGMSNPVTSLAEAATVAADVISGVGRLLIGFFELLGERVEEGAMSFIGRRSSWIIVV